MHVLHVTTCVYSWYVRSRYTYPPHHVYTMYCMCHRMCITVHVTLEVVPTVCTLLLPLYTSAHTVTHCSMKCTLCMCTSRHYTTWYRYHLTRDVYPLLMSCICHLVTTHRMSTPGDITTILVCSSVLACLDGYIRIQASAHLLHVTCRCCRA